MEKLFMVQIEFAYNYEHGVETYLFTDERNAQLKFNAIKKHELKESWIADGRICKNNKPEDGDIIISTDNNSCFSAYIYGSECETHTYLHISEEIVDGSVNYGEEQVECSKG